MKSTSIVIVGLLVVSLGLFGCVSQPSSQDWVTLIDADKGLENWSRVGDGNWRAVDGVIQVDSRTQKGASYLVTKNDYADFQIRVEFWFDEKSNSGIYIRCSDVNKIADTNCYEAQISDTRPDGFSTGAIVHIAKVSPPVPKAAGQWSVYEITAKGDQLTVVLNGVKTAEARDSKFKSGPLALQYAAGVVKFRKVQIRPL